MGEVSTLYGVDFKDPLVKNPKLANTIGKTMDTYIQHLQNEEAQEYVGKSILHTINSCLVPKYGADIKKLDELVIDKLEKQIIGGNEINVQNGSISVLYQILKLAHTKNYQEMFKYIYDRGMNMIC